MDVYSPPYIKKSSTLQPLDNSKGPSNHPLQIARPPALSEMQAAPSLASPEPLGLFAQEKASKLLKLMAQPSDSEDTILEHLKRMSSQDLLSYQYIPYASILEAALVLMRPGALQFLVSKWESSANNTPLSQLTQEDIIHHLKTAMDTYTKHIHSGGHRDFDRPCVSLPITEKMIMQLVDLFKLKFPQDLIMELLIEKNETLRFAPDALSFLKKTLLAQQGPKTSSQAGLLIEML
jgi:hypothetical protein